MKTEKIVGAGGVSEKKGWEKSGKIFRRLPRALMK